MLAKWIPIAVLAASLQGCAGYDLIVQHRRGDAPWDPKAGHTLLEQIPAWDHAAVAQCGGALRPEQLQPGMSLRC